MKSNCMNEIKIMKAEVDFDDLLSAAGEFGRYQILLFISTFPFYLFGVFVYFTPPFITEVSDHWCWIPELENYTVADRKLLAIPPDENSRFEYSKCRSYVANWTEVLTTGAKPNRTWTTETCQHGWEFNSSEIPYPTVTSEMFWVCEKASYSTIALAVFYAGSVFGGLIMGWISDKYGRLPAAILSNIVGCLGGTISAFTRNFVEFAICRFVLGMASDSCMMLIYLLVLEYVAPKYRSLISSLSFALFYAPSVTLLPWIALACGHWKIICLATSIPLSLALFTPLIIPESPRWLLSNGRVEDAIEKAVMISRINRKKIASTLIEKFRISVSKQKNEDSLTILDLLRSSVLRKVFIYMCVVFAMCHLVFDGLVRGIEQLQYDFFISFSIVSSTEFPSLLLSAFIMDLVGRQWLTVVTMIISAIFSVLIVSVGSGIPSVVCAVVARFAANMGYGTVLQWAAEVLPTNVRGFGVSIVFTLSEITTLLTPYVMYLENYAPWLSYAVISLFAIICMVFAMLLPETAGKIMPQTFDDAEEMVRNKKLFDMPFMQKKQSNVESNQNDGIEM